MNLNRTLLLYCGLHLLIFLVFFLLISDLQEFVFSFLLSCRLFLRPHELLGRLLDSVPDSECLESLVSLLAEWTMKFPYDYRDERMMSHVKHIVARWGETAFQMAPNHQLKSSTRFPPHRCSNSHLEAAVSQTLSALLKRLTDLERHEADLRACQTNDKVSGCLASAVISEKHVPEKYLKVFRCIYFLLKLYYA